MAGYRPSTLAIAVLSLLFEVDKLGQPGIHPYRMQQLIKERGKDRVINVGQRASLYRTIERLAKAGLIEVGETTREQQRPERTSYTITESGRAAWRAWMVEVLSTPSREYPEFPAAVSFLAGLPDTEALSLLEKRRERLREELDNLDTEYSSVPDLDRLFRLENEYLRATTAAELHWVESVVNDLRAKRLTWNFG